MTFALALDGRFESFGDYRQPTGATAESTPVQKSSTGQVPAVQQQAMPAKTDWDETFGENSYLYRTSNGNSPFIIKTRGRVEEREVEGADGTYTQNVSVEGGGQWRYNNKTDSFDFYPLNYEAGNKSWKAEKDYLDKPTKSVSAASIGLDYDPAFMISALATKNGKNGDSWSDYALTHNDYGEYGTDAYNRSVSDGFRSEWSKITSYDAKVSGFDKFIESAVVGGIVTIATMGFGAPLATAMKAAGYSAGTAAVASNAIVGAAMGGTTAAITGGDPLKGALLGGAGGAIGGYSSTLSKTGGLLSTSNMVNTAGKTALAAVSGGDPVATLASSVAGSAAGAATDSPFVGQLASQATRQLVTKQPTQSISQGRPSTSTKAAQSTQSTQNTPGASFSYSLPSFNYVDLMGKRG